MKSTKFIFYLALFFFAVSPVRTFGGDPGGPYVIWVNLSNNTAIEKLLKKKIDKEMNDPRIPSTSVFLFTLRPPRITNKLVRKAVLNKDKKAIKLLQKRIQLPFEDFDKGFDGIIVYDEVSAPRFSNVVRGTCAVTSEVISKPTDSDIVWDTFLMLIPDVTRKP